MMELTVAEKRELLILARETIMTYLEKRSKKYPTTANPKYLEKTGVFVTLHQGKELRGCIGYPLPYKPLYQAVMDNAISAATEDPRFQAVTAADMADIDIEISVLTPPQEVSKIDQVTVGRDGIVITKGWMKGLLLPQVPVEQGWDREQFLSHGCLKAGLPPDEWQRGVHIETFQAIVFGEKKLGR